MADGTQGFTLEDDSGPDAPGARAVVCDASAGPGLDGGGHSEGVGAGPPHHWTVGRCLWRGRAFGSDLRADRRFPPALDQAQQEELKGAVQQPPAASGMEQANWYWKGVRQFVWEHFGLSLCRSSCLNWLHRLGFAFKRPKKRLVKANESMREVFVAEYAALRGEARETGVRILFADEAHFRADAELRGKWVLKGEPALVDSTSPQHGEKASYYSVVCLETDEVEWMELGGEQQQRKLRCLPGTVAPEAWRAS